MSRLIGTVDSPVRSTESPPSDIDLLHRLVRDREALQPAFASAWRAVSAADPAAVRRWAAATLELSRVNAGIPSIEAFWKLPASPANLEAGPAAADVCRFAGARAALACLEAHPAARRLLGDGPAGVCAWWQAMIRLAREASASVQIVATRAERLLPGGDGLAFLDFIAAGLKATATDKRRRAAFFAGSDPLAELLLSRRRGVVGFAESERMLVAFVAGLWGGAPRLRAAPDAPVGQASRTAIASGIVILPAVFTGTPEAQTRALYRAAVAHAHAHLTAPAVVLPLQSLRPLQVAIVGLVEDARVEALAIRRFPGLRALWAAWHVAAPRGAATALNLMARLARALLDPAYDDPNGFVQKGRALFAAAEPQWTDPSVSRAIGGLLGNDLGQMRVQFNAKTYAVEPAYRDDNLHLWELPEAPDDALSLSIESARGAEDGDGHDQPGDGSPAPRARDAGLEDRGAVLATYPEWDGAARVERPDWTTVRDTLPILRTPSFTSAERRLHAEIERTVRSSAIGQRTRRPPQEDGEDLDIDRAINAIVATRMSDLADPRLFRDGRPKGRDLATLLILDTSQSTAARSAAGTSVLDTQRIAVTALAAALEARSDRYALRSFASNGRDDVRLTRLKEFDEPLDDAVRRRLAGLLPGLSTRLGAALRHSGAELDKIQTTRKLVLILTDGEPSDIDVANPRELVEDARRAVFHLRQRGIDVFGVVMDPYDAGSGATIFGRHNTLTVRRLEELPARLTGMYFRLAQR